MTRTLRRTDSCRSRSSLVLLLVALVGCGAPSEERATTPAPEEVAPAAAESTAPAFGVHEWGVVDFSSGTPHVRTRPGPRPSAPSSGVPRIRREVVTVDKPVLYVHLLDGAASARFDVRLDVNGGGVAELYPLMLPGSLGMPNEDGEVQDETESIDSLDGDGLVDDRLEADIPALREIFWQGVEASPGQCVVSRPYPTMASDLCERALAEDGVCEVASLREYETADGACLRYGGETYEHLFYRLRMGAVEAPLMVAGLDPGVLVANRSENAIPGPIFVMRRTGYGVLPEGLPGHGSARVAIDQRRSSFPRAMGTSLLAMGLTEDEAVAFERAWNREFMRVTDEEIGLVYRMPDCLVEGIAPLRISPAPRELVRAWVALDRQRESGPRAVTPNLGCCTCGGGV